MRRVVVVLLAAGLTVGSAASGSAQDSTRTEDAVLQPIDVPAAGVAISFPADWSADVEMREREDWGLFDEGFSDEPVLFWNVVYASDGGRPWCDLTWYPFHPLTATEHAERYLALMTPSTDAERSIESTATALPAGEATRFDIYNEPTDDYTTTYLLAVGDARYLLRCTHDEPAEDYWLEIAESVVLVEPQLVVVEEE